MEILVFWVGLCLIVAYVANNKGRSGLGWFVGSLLLSPLLGFIAVLIVSDKRKTA